MRSLSFSMVLVLCCLMSRAQLPAPDHVKTGKGDLVIQPVFHATMVLTWDNKTVYVDPYHGAAAFKGMKDPDLILITDIHGDHMDLATLKELNTTNSKLVVPQAVAEKLPEDLKAKAVVLNNGEKKEVLGIPISAVPMYNLPEDSASRHTKGRGNGYVLTLGGKNVYISGDTEDIPEMRKLQHIDIAFVCMNLPFTMDVQHAASAVLDFKPVIVYPFHYRGQDTGAFKELVNKENKNIEVRLRNWYPQ